jgi:hypothetical protein
MTVAATLLGVLLAAIGQFLARWEAARRAADERLRALGIVENVLEQAAATVHRQHVAPTLSLPPGTDSILNSPRLEVAVGPRDASQLTSLTASLSWENAQGQRVTPVALTTWLLTPESAAGAQP